MSFLALLPKEDEKKIIETDILSCPEVEQETGRIQIPQTASHGTILMVSFVAQTNSVWSAWIFLMMIHEKQISLRLRYLFLHPDGEDKHEVGSETVEMSLIWHSRSKAALRCVTAATCVLPNT